MPSIKKNFLYNSFLTTANYIFPFLTYPYVTRVLGVDKIGAVNYVDSIINYFILFSMLGFGIVGIREVIDAKQDKQKLNSTFSSLLLFNAFTTLIAVAILVACIYTIPNLRQNEPLLYVGVFKLLGNFLLIDWLFKGLEDFKFITMRTLVVKCLYVAAVFIFVRDASDYILFYVLMTLMVVVNSLVNCVYARKFVRFTLKGLSFKPLVKPVVILGIYMLLTSMYNTFNTMYLGYTCGDTQVGYFTTATKLFLIILSVFTAFTNVMLPRMTDIVKHEDYDKFNMLLDKSMKTLLAFALPLVILMIFFAENIIFVIAGPGFEGAVLPMQICTPLILIIGYEQIVVLQALMPLKKDKSIFINSIIGASVALLLCFTIIKPLQSVGASIVMAGSEISVALSASVFAVRYIRFKVPYGLIIKSILYYLPLIILLYLTKAILVDNDGFSFNLMILIIATLATMIYSFILQYYILKDEVIVSMTNKAFKRIFSK